MSRNRSSRTLTDWTFGIFAAEVRARCRDGLFAADLLDQGLGVRNVDMIWFALRSILIAAAAISQLTGGRTGPKRTERASLRHALGIDDHSVLHQRAVRDGAEHADDRIFRRVESGELANFIGYNVGPKGIVHFDPPQKSFLHFDPTTGVVSFWDDEVSIPEVLAEIRCILPLADAAFLKPPNISRPKG